MNETGKPYQPANHDDGELFVSRWCDQCRKKEVDNELCDILNRAIVYEIGHGYYPTEWVYDEAGKPCCIAFEATK